MNPGETAVGALNNSSTPVFVVFMFNWGLRALVSSTAKGNTLAELNWILINFLSASYKHKKAGKHFWGIFAINVAFFVLIATHDDYVGVWCGKESTGVYFKATLNVMSVNGFGFSIKLLSNSLLPIRRFGAPVTCKTPATQKRVYIIVEKTSRVKKKESKNSSLLLMID